jgi:cellulose synthase/poly-beta-1,6-N-acetylglucosamine synthase-like glycosyltransferase
MVSVSVKLDAKEKLSDHSLSVVIPALNEEGNIQGSIDSVTSAAERYFDDYEIIIVNDGSTDRTLEIVQANIEKNPRIRVISHDKPWGFGASYHDGRRHARKTYTVMVHGDNAFDKETLSNFLSKAGKADVVCGYISNPSARNWTRRIISFSYTVAMNLIFGLRLKYFNGLQIHRTAWLKDADVKSDGFGFQAELLIKAIKEGSSYIQVPTIHTERPGGGETKIFKTKNVKSVTATVVDLFVWRIRQALKGKRK